jgi:hypothetical protein
MEQRFLSDLKGEELTFVWEKNYRLQEEVRSCYEDYLLGRVVDDYLFVLKSGLRNWSIGFCNYNTIQIKNNSDFLDACVELQKNFCLLCGEDGYPTKYDDLIEKGKERLMQLICAETDSEYEKLEVELEEYIGVLHDKIIEQIDKELDYSEEDVMEFFFECWLDDYADDGYFIDDDYELFLTTLKTKSFK